MSMSQKVTRSALAVAALGALALGGSALADAATKSGSSPSTQSAQQGTTAQQGYGAPQRAPGGPNGGHVGTNGQRETLLTGDTAAKVKAAALAKVGSGATVERVETDVDHGSPYEAHVRRSDGTELEVLVNDDFQVTAVNTMRHP